LWLPAVHANGGIEVQLESSALAVMRTGSACANDFISALPLERRFSMHVIE
jgi:hypothetical protein